MLESAITFLVTAVAWILIGVAIVVVVCAATIVAGWIYLIAQLLWFWLVPGRKPTRKKTSL